MKQVILTEQGKDKLEKELDELRTVRRKEVAEKLKEAKSFGDLSENSEYDEAKNEQAQLETRIQQLEVMLKHARIIDEEDVTTDVVSVGSKVKVEYVDDHETEVYSIVGSTEVDPLAGRISDESPIGRALIGHNVGDEVDVSVPDDKNSIIKLRILEIDKIEL